VPSLGFDSKVLKECVKMREPHLSFSDVLRVDFGPMTNTFDLSLKYFITYLMMCSGFCATFVGVNSASAATPSEEMATKLKKDIQASGFKADDLGLWVGSRSEKNLNSKLETFFSHNSERLYIPASLSKLVTLGAALHELKPGFKFKTLLVSDAKIDDGVLQGALYLKGAGDPSFVSENMWFLVNELTRAGVRLVEGDVVVDDNRFDHIRWGDDRQEERVDRAYDAPIGAMSMNWNSVNVYVRPGDKVGDKAKVFADVMTPYIKVRNEAKTVAAGRGKTIAIERTSEDGFAGDVVVVTGSIAKDQPEFSAYKNITQPDVWAATNLVEFLRQRGVQVKGKVRVGTAPKDAPVLATAESKPLAYVVADMAKWSNNYVAEMLVKNLAAEAGELPATMASGMQHVQKYLVEAGLEKGKFDFVNAAGFTRKNHLTPQQLGRVLEHVRADFTIFPEYLAALPVAGVDGTLRKRMIGTSAQRWVRAKTGLLNGVVGLAGYAGRENGPVVSFAFIYNGSGHEDKARALFDKMAAHLVED
jgi:D-alanyl-D-alanine carboxypeptidase/D-alanyl-D-alanine-endopeptidase (penicillin-binding protein 4)